MAWTQRVGGEGMRAFYDQIAPSVLQDVLRKVGGDRMTQIRQRQGQPLLAWSATSIRPPCTCRSRWAPSPSWTLAAASVHSTCARRRKTTLMVVRRAQPNDITRHAQERSGRRPAAVRPPAGHAGLPAATQALQRNPMDAQARRDIVAPIAQKWGRRSGRTPADLPVKAPPTPWACT